VVDVRTRWIVALAVAGLALVGFGVYVRTSEYTECAEGADLGPCYGAYTSDAWQVAGLVSLGVGIAVLLGALFLAWRRRRQQ
jgi:hypothetical protein